MLIGHACNDGAMRKETSPVKSVMRLVLFFFFFYFLHSQQHATLLLLYLLTLDPLPVLPSSMQLKLFILLDEIVFYKVPILLHHLFFFIIHFGIQVPLVSRKLSFKKFPASLQTLLVFCIQFRTLVSYLTLKP